MTKAPILVGIDFSDGAATAVAWADALAELFDAPLVACHVADRERGPWDEEELLWLASVGVPPDRVAVRQGVPWIGLSRLADEVRATLLVVGSHGVKGYQPLFPGSTTGQLLSKARQPILVVPSPRRGASWSAVRERARSLLQG